MSWLDRLVQMCVYWSDEVDPRLGKRCVVSCQCCVAGWRDLVPRVFFVTELTFLAPTVYHFFQVIGHGLEHQKSTTTASRRSAR